MAAWRGLGWACPGSGWTCPGRVQGVSPQPVAGSRRLQLLDAHEALLELASLLHHALLEPRRPHAHVAVLAGQRDVVLLRAERELLTRLHRHRFAGEGDRLVHQAAGLFLRLLRERRGERGDFDGPRRRVVLLAEGHGRRRAQTAQKLSGVKDAGQKLSRAL